VHPIIVVQEGKKSHLLTLILLLARSEVLEYLVCVICSVLLIQGTFDVFEANSDWIS
jgi:hypothetical protein